VTTPNTVEFAGKIVTVGAFPIGIDPEKFTEGLKRPQVQERIQQLQEKFKGVKLIIGVDRLDYIKGVPQKLHTLQYFLETHPEWVGKVQLIQIAVPSRQDVEEYQDLRRTVNELVGRINGQFGRVRHRQSTLHSLILFQVASNSTRYTSSIPPWRSTSCSPSTQSATYV